MLRAYPRHCALLALPVFACARHRAPPDPPVAWSTAAPGLDVAKVAPAPDVEAWAVRYDQDLYSLSLRWSPTGLRIPDALPKGFVAAVNGGYFERDLRPSGLLIVDGRQIQAESGHHGALVLRDGRASLSYLHDVRASETASVLQAWPFLIEPGGADGIRTDDGRRSRRTAFGIDTAGRGLIVAVPDQGLSLHQLMCLCRRLGATSAVNLDGGPSTGFALALPPGWTSETATDVSNLLVLTRRAPLPQAADERSPSDPARSTATHAL